MFAKTKILKKKIMFAKTKILKKLSIYSYGIATLVIHIKMLFICLYPVKKYKIIKIHLDR